MKEELLEKENHENEIEKETSEDEDAISEEELRGEDRLILLLEHCDCLVFTIPR